MCSQTCPAKSASAGMALNGLQLASTSIQSHFRVLADFCVHSRIMVSYSLIAFCVVALSLPGVNGAKTTVESHPKFVPLHPASPGSSIELTLGLPPSNVEGLHAALLDVSDPDSPNYGKYLSKSEVEAFVAPTPESVKVITDWLSKTNIKPKVVSPSGDMLRVDVSVQAANALLAANYTEFEDQTTNQTIVRTLSYSLPADVQKHLQFIYPTTQFFGPLIPSKPPLQVIQPPRAKSKRATPLAGCDEEINPQCLQDIYNIPAAPATNPGNSLGVTGYLNEFATQDDLDSFFLTFRPDVPTTPSFDVVSFDDGIISGDGTLEASLDIQYTVGLATNVPTTFYSDGRPDVIGFIDMANSLLALDEVPLVLSTSYGFDEDIFNDSQEIANTLCNAYAQLGARGTSVLFCSGDNGVYSFNNSKCSATEFGPTFPSGCPFLTSVGGTQGIDPEVTASFSSGGFSNIFARPSYQDAAVQNYLTQLGSTNAGLFNTSGRGFPDVSAQSVNFITRISGESRLLYGTSASTPTFASVVALLNDKRLDAGQPSLGFLNPLLYSQGASALNDITVGSNPGCGAQGFPALEGWDPATGLGTPDYEKLLNLVLSVAGGKSE
ncbi:subtilisin-like protein [Fomes fomentarius]|nr:subtilisin-like protein [Fomes fomentarius]